MSAKAYIAMLSATKALSSALSLLSISPNELAAARSSLAPTGVLRAAINMSNFLLVTNRVGPDGISPALARALGLALGVQVELVPYAGPQEVVDAASRGEWDVANIAADGARTGIAFSTPYAEIQSSILVATGSSIQTFTDVDQDGVVVLSKAGAAYTQWLQRNLVRAQVRGVESVERGLEDFRTSEKNVVLAGLRSRLMEDSQVAGGHVIPGAFCVARQAIGVETGKNIGFVTAFVRAVIESGYVEALIREHGIEGNISVSNG